MIVMLERLLTGWWLPKRRMPGLAAARRAGARCPRPGSRPAARLASAMLAGAASLVAVAPLSAQTLKFPDYALQPRQIAPNTWVIEGAVDDFSRANGCNIINTGFIATGAGVIVINTGPSRLYGEQQRQAIARVTREPVTRVLNLNLHPDYFFGNQAFADVPTQALDGSIAGMRREGGAYADNLYRLCGDWMKGTESTPAREAIAPARLRVGGHELELLRLDGHTSDDLVLVDRTAGVMYAGGLVFAARTPTTPHADIDAWLRSLDALEAAAREAGVRHVVPSHGPVRADMQGFDDTRAYLRWLDARLAESAERGLDLNDVLKLPVPERFGAFAAFASEYLRNVTHLYPRYELRALGR